MKLYTGIIFFIISSIAFGQEEVKISFEKHERVEDFKSEDLIGYIVHGNEEELFFISRVQGIGINQVNSNILFVKRNVKTLEREVLVNIEVKEKDYYSGEGQFGFKLNNYLYFFYTRTNSLETKRELIVSTYNLVTKEMEVKQEVLCSSPYKKTKGNLLLGYFTFAVNSSKSSFAILDSRNSLLPNNEDGDPINIWEFKSDLSLISHNTLDLGGEPYAIYKTMYSKDEKIILLGDKGGETYNGLSLIEFEKGATKVYSLKETEVEHLRHEEMVVVNNTIFICGKYHNENKDMGLFTFHLDEQRNVTETKYSFMEMEVLSEFASKWKSPKKIDFDIDDSELIEIDGNFVYTVSKGALSNSVSEAILVSCFDKEGKKKWQNLLNTWYGRTNQIHFSTLIKGNQGVLFINDNRKFYTEKIDKDYKFGYIVYDINDGSFEKKLLLESRVNLSLEFLRKEDKVYYIFYNIDNPLPGDSWVRTFGDLLRFKIE